MASAYYDPSTSPPTLREFPLAERFESTPLGRRGGPTGRTGRNLAHITEEEHVWQYQQSRRREWRLIYRLTTEAQLLFFYNLHINVDGAEPFSEPFTFVLDYDNSPSGSALVRKRGDWMPPGIPTPTVENGYIIGVYDYVLELVEESEAGYVLA